MVGSAIYKALLKKGYGQESKGGSILIPDKKELDLSNASLVKDWYSRNKPTVTIIAAQSRRILANQTCPTDFLLNNLKIQNNVIESAWLSGVKDFFFEAVAYILNSQINLSKKNIF